MVQVFFVGIGAGLASALLFLSPLGGTSLAYPLFILCGLPVALAGLAWTALAGAIAALAATLVLAFAIGVPGAGIFLVTFGAPLAWLAWLAALARQGAAGEEWYPLGRLLLHAAIAAAVGAILAGAIIGFDPAALAAEMADMLSSWFAGSPELGAAPTAAEMAPFIRVNIELMPFTVPAITLVVLVFTLWLAGRIATASGRLRRPWQPVSTVALPNLGLLLFAAGTLGAFIPGPVGYAAETFSGAFGGAAALVGLAVLHAITVGMGLRILVLAGAYLATIFLGFPFFLLVLAGFADSFVNFRARRPGGAPPTPTDKE